MNSLFRIEKSCVKLQDAWQDAADTPAGEPLGCCAQGAPAERHPSARVSAETLLAEAREAAEALVRQAEEQAAQARGDARAAAELEAREIYERALRDGHRAGQEQALQAGREQAEALALLAEGLRRGREEELRRLEGEMVTLSLAVAKKVIGCALDRDEQAFRSMIATALSGMNRAGQLLVRLSEGDFARLFPSGTATFDLGDRQVVAQVAGDPFMQPHGCQIESAAEMVDAGLESQMAAITLAFSGGEEA